MMNEWIDECMHGCGLGIWGSGLDSGRQTDKERGTLLAKLSIEDAAGKTGPSLALA